MHRFLQGARLRAMPIGVLVPAGPSLTALRYFRSDALAPFFPHDVARRYGRCRRRLDDAAPFHGPGPRAGDHLNAGLPHWAAATAPYQAPDPEAFIGLRTEIAIPYK